MKKLLVLLLGIISILCVGCFGDSDDGKDLSLESLTVFEKMARENGYTEEDVRKIAKIVTKCGVDLNKTEEFNGGLLYKKDNSKQDLEISIDAQKKNGELKVYSVVFNTTYDAYRDGNYGDFKADDFFMDSKVLEKLADDIKDKLEDKYHRENVHVKSIKLGDGKVRGKDKDSVECDLEVSWTEKDKTFGAKGDLQKSALFIYDVKGKFIDSTVGR